MAYLQFLTCTELHYSVNDFRFMRVCDVIEQIDIYKEMRAAGR